MKERIIGAAVLVLFVVLVVPVFLDGLPNDAELISERVPLPGQSDQETRTVVLDRDRSEPVPVPSNGGRRDTMPETAAVSKAATEKPEPPAPQPEREPKPAARKPESPKSATVISAERPSATGMWAVQLGSFGNKENAERLAADLRKQGFAAFLSQLATESGALHRVRIGPQKNRDSSEAMA